MVLKRIVRCIILEMLVVKTDENRHVMLMQTAFFIDIVIRKTRCVFSLSRIVIVLGASSPSSTSKIKYRSHKTSLKP